MKCNKCNLEIESDFERCPLCQNSLEGSEITENSDVFPYIPTVYKEFNLFFRALVFISVTVGAITVLLNMVIDDFGFWSLIVIIGIAFIWLEIYMITRKRRNIQKTIIYSVLLANTGSVIIDLMFGFKGWSIDYVLPCSFIVAIITFAILYKVLKMPIKAYILYYVICEFFGILPLLFYLIGIVNVVIPSLICIMVSIISSAGLIVFCGKEMLDELKRRFHL